MRNRNNDQNTDNSSFNKDYKQFAQVDGDPGAEDQSTDLIEKQHLGDGYDRYNKAGHRILAAGDQNCRGEHISKANNHSFRGSHCFRYVKKFQKRVKGNTQPVKNRCEIGDDQSQGTNRHNRRENAEPHS